MAAGTLKARCRLCGVQFEHALVADSAAAHREALRRPLVEHRCGPGRLGLADVLGVVSLHAAGLPPLRDRLPDPAPEPEPDPMPEHPHAG